MNIMKLFKDKKVVIAGPCSFASYKELDIIASKLKELNIDILRAGTFKGRTNPNAFQGLGDKGVEILLEIRLRKATNAIYSKVNFPNIIR